MIESFMASIILIAIGLYIWLNPTDTQRIPTTWKSFDNLKAYYDNWEDSK